MGYILGRRKPIKKKASGGTLIMLGVCCRLISLVARAFKPKGYRDREDLFAAMPPLEAKKILFWMAANQIGAGKGH
jgi:hypothetical protein